MATKKTTRKTTKTAARTRKAAKRSGKAVSKTAAKKAKPTTPSTTAAKGPAKADSANPNGALRVRMYRVGFGDFFLLTVPTPTGPQHILIDCGVHAGDINSIKDCVLDLATETKGKLALVVATHYHADHLSGFASQYDEFAKFEVGAVWITNRLDPNHAGASKFKSKITALANQLQLQLQLRLGAGEDETVRQALHKAQNAVGAVQLGAAEGGNEKALRLLTKGFKNFQNNQNPPVFYYQGDQEPELPEVLKGSITAQLLAPAPLDSDGVFSSSDNKTEQYLSAAADQGLPPTDGLAPFEKHWPASAANYPGAFEEYRTEEQIKNKQPGTSIVLEQTLQAAQPDVLLAMADALDGTLNNQSLVILFTCQGKKLLFVGDAQWGNWSYWLYGKKVTGKDPGIAAPAKKILGSIDFYKVGHHGSTNANPMPAVAALKSNCVSMCSTECNDENPDPVKAKKRPYGKIPTSEVPRIPLMVAMEKQTGDRLVRSDWIDVPTAAASPEAKGQLAQLPENFSRGNLYVDYVFPE